MEKHLDHIKKVIIKMDKLIKIISIKEKIKMINMIRIVKMKIK